MDYIYSFFSSLLEVYLLLYVFICAMKYSSWTNMSLRGYDRCESSSSISIADIRRLMVYILLSFYLKKKKKKEGKKRRKYVELGWSYGDQAPCIDAPLSLITDRHIHQHKRSLKYSPFLKKENIMVVRHIRSQTETFCYNLLQQTKHPWCFTR